MLGIAASLLGSPLGRKLVVWGLVAIAVGFVILRIFKAGKDAERAKQDKQSLKNLRERIRLDDEIVSLPKEQRLQRLQKWVSE